MQIESIKFQGHRCFKQGWSGFDTIKPINVIIGRNNTGKSHLLDLAELLCSNGFYALAAKKQWKLKCSGELDETTLKLIFKPDANTARGNIHNSMWNHIGQFLVGSKMSWETESGGSINGSPVVGSVTQSIGGTAFQGCKPEDMLLLTQVALSARTNITGKAYRHLRAERDIQPEGAGNDLQLTPQGAGATNIIRRYIHSSSTKVSRELIQNRLLEALNRIFAKDGRFTEIVAKQHDEPESGHPQDSWEIFLSEEKKGLVALSRSGSGLKTIILVLLNLLVVPEFEHHRKANYTFAFEELENNLHPSLLRRLFQYIEHYATEEGSAIFLTTHSSVALDVFGMSSNAQIIHVKHNGESASTETIAAHFDRLNVISELGAKPSDLLQANGVIWLEGPSDRVYLNCWIHLFSDGKWQEGRDYQCAFYGGSLLARAQFKSPEAAEKDLANLFRVNPNIVVICDSDRTALETPLKARVERIQEEVRQVPGGHAWITGAKEIENYLPGAVLAGAVEKPSLPDPGEYEIFFPLESAEAGTSYIEKNLHRKTFDKIARDVNDASYDEGSNVVSL